MDSTLPRIAAFLARTFAFAAAGALAPAFAFNHVNAVAPRTIGPFAVACSNVAQDAASIAAGSNAPDYWEGRGGHYITDLLTSPQSVVRFGVAVPDDALYPGNRGRVVDFVAIACYPTTAGNPDPNYPLPGGEVVPHMQPAGSAPRLIGQREFYATLGTPPSFPSDETMRLPLVIFSHGLTGSPISKGYVSAMVALASHGYVVAAPFHGDPRFSRVRVEDISDFFYLITQFDQVVEMQLMRPLSLKAMVDRMLADSGFSPAIDTERIAGFGASLGGEAMLHLLGASITGTIGRSCRDAPSDSRIRAAVGFVPYAGQTFLPAFCDGQSGARTVDRPFLAMSGTADTTAPLAAVEDTINQMKGSRYLVELRDVPHEFRPEYAGDMFTWTVTFLNAYLDVAWDSTAMARFIRMKSVNGGPADNVTIDVHVARGGPSGEIPVHEFHNTFLDHYFLASNADELDYIARGNAGPGWVLTGESFDAWAQPPLVGEFGAGPVCRFYGAAAGGPNSHFFTAVTQECDFVKGGGAGGWFYEGTAFHIRPVDQTQVCPDGYFGVNRAYNNRAAQGDPNHRLTTSDSTIRDMQARGWINEGIMMCARP